MGEIGLVMLHLVHSGAVLYLSMEDAMPNMTGRPSGGIKEQNNYKQGRTGSATPTKVGPAKGGIKSNGAKPGGRR